MALSFLYSPTLTSIHDYWENHNLDFGQVMSLLFNMPSRLVIAFLPRNKHLLISWLQSPSAVILEPKRKRKTSVTVSIFPHLFAMKWWDQMEWSYFGTVLLFWWSSWCWQLDLSFLCLFYIQLEHLEVSGSRTDEAWLGEFWALLLLACEMSAIVWYFEHSLALPFFVLGMKTDLFQSCGHCWVFQICWHVECSTLTVYKQKMKDNFTFIVYTAFSNVSEFLF